MKTTTKIISCLLIATGCTIERPYEGYKYEPSDYPGYPSRAKEEHGYYDPYPSYEDYHGFKPSPYQPKLREKATIDMEEISLSANKTSYDAKVRMKISGKTVNAVALLAVYTLGRISIVDSSPCSDGDVVELEGVFLLEKFKYLEVRVFDSYDTVIAYRRLLP